MTDASWVERAVLVVILLTSLTLFWWRFRKVLKVIRGSRATTDFEVSPLGPRIRQFLWEVMLQGKVIEQRPFPGLAHAFVYWAWLIQASTKTCIRPNRLPPWSSLRAVTTTDR